MAFKESNVLTHSRLSEILIPRILAICVCSRNNAKDCHRTIFETSLCKREPPFGPQRTSRCLRHRRGFVAQYFIVLDLRSSCQALSASMRWTMTISRCSLAFQPIRKCHDSHVGGICIILFWVTRLQASTRLVAAKNRLECGKLMARQILTRFEPDKKPHYYDKKLDSVRHH